MLYGDRDLHLEVAKLIGEPINYQLPVPVEIQAIANIDTVEPGENLWRYTAVDTDSDTIIQIDATDGKIKTVKRAPIGDTELTFTGLNSKLEYVLVNDVLASPDTKVLGRKKEAILRGMDKRELKLIIDGIEAGTNVPTGASIQSVTPASGDDLYDVIVAMKHKLEDYGDNYILLAGSTVKEAIDTYDKDNASTHNYNVNLMATLKALGIDVMKIYGKVEVTDGGGEVALMNANHLILVAKNSRVANGLPVWFVRRRITPDIAKLMGADVDQAQRAIVVNPTPVMVDFSGTSSNVLAYGVYGFESVVFAIPNPKAICTCDATSVL